MSSRFRSVSDDPAEADSIRQQLQQILDSTPFRTSKRCSDFLRYVVEGLVGGRAELLKERTVGVAVFDRPPDYDTNQDPVVRNTAGQVRKRLAQYYCEPGRDQEIRIDLPPGAYVPNIHLPVVAVETPVVEPTIALERAPARQPWLAISLLGVVAGLITAGLVLLFSRYHSETDLDRFWKPLVKFRGPIVICVGQGHTYKLRGDLDRLFEESAVSQRMSSGAGVPMGDIVPAWDRYVGLNDAQTLLRLTALFSRSGKNVSLLGGRASSLADLRGKPSVLVGAFNNDWTLSLTGELRFYFQDDPKQQLEFVRDRQHPGNSSWSLPRDNTAQVSMDYAIVSRVFNRTTEQPVVVAAGIRGGGTQAAGELLTNPAYLAAALSDAPKQWEDGNLQFVIATKIFSGTSGPPRVVATYYWH